MRLCSGLLSWSNDMPGSGVKLDLHNHLLLYNYWNTYQDGQSDNLLSSNMISSIEIYKRTDDLNIIQIKGYLMSAVQYLNEKAEVVKKLHALAMNINAAGSL